MDEQQEFPKGKILIYNGSPNDPDSLLFTICPDGAIEKGPGFTTDDEVSLKFWELLGNSFSEWKQKALAIDSNALGYIPYEKA